jgi:hypothetical protein
MLFPIFNSAPFKFNVAAGYPDIGSTPITIVSSANDALGKSRSNGIVGSTKVAYARRIVGSNLVDRFSYANARFEKELL